MILHWLNGRITEVAIIEMVVTEWKIETIILIQRKKAEIEKEKSCLTSLSINLLQLILESSSSI